MSDLTDRIKAVLEKDVAEVEAFFESAVDKIEKLFDDNDDTVTAVPVVVPAVADTAEGATIAHAVNAADIGMANSTAQALGADGVGAVDTTVLPGSLVVTPTDLTLKVGDTRLLTVEVSPPETTDTAITFTSRDIAVATVDADGGVTAVAVGTTSIVATSSVSTVAATVPVTVTE